MLKTLNNYIVNIKQIKIKHLYYKDYLNVRQLHGLRNLL